jgi:hypothetical protein
LDLIFVLLETDFANLKCIRNLEVLFYG